MEENVREVSLEEASNIRGGEVITIGLGLLNSSSPFA